MIRQQQWKSFIKWKKINISKFETILLYRHDTIHMAVSDWPVTTDYKKLSLTTYMLATCMSISFFTKQQFTFVICKLVSINEIRNAYLYSIQRHRHVS